MMVDLRLATRVRSARLRTGDSPTRDEGTDDRFHAGLWCGNDGRVAHQGVAVGARRSHTCPRRRPTPLRGPIRSASWPTPRWLPPSATWLWLGAGRMRY